MKIDKFSDEQILKRPIPIRKDVNVIPVYDLLYGVFSEKFNDDDIIDSQGRLTMPPEEVLDSFISNLKYRAFSRKTPFFINNKVDLFFSLSKVISDNYNGQNMDYRHLNNVFFMNSTWGNSNHLYVIKPNGNGKIVCLNGVVYEIDINNNIRMLFCIAIKKEWIVDVLVRTYMRDYHNFELSNDSFVLLYDNEFDHKDFDYKPLRSWFRKNVKKPFENKGIGVMGCDNLLDLFREEVKLPSFLVEEQKDDWAEEIVGEVFTEFMVV